MESNGVVFRSAFASDNDSDAVVLLYTEQLIKAIYYRSEKDGAFHKLSKPISRKDGSTFDVSCLDPQTGEEYEFLYEFEPNQLTWCGERLVKDNSLIDTAKFVPPIDQREIEYLCGNDDTMVLVTVPKSDYRYDLFKLYVGNADGTEMREIPVRLVSRLRDGGTTSIFTDEGEFSSPSPFKANAKPSWNGRRLQHIDKSTFVVDEAPGGVTVSKK